MRASKAMDRPGATSGAMAAVFGALLLGCAPVAVPPAPTAPPAPVEPAAEPPAPSPESDLIRAYFASQEASLLSRGLMRTNAEADDAPFTVNMVTANFVRIALFDEYTEIAGRLVARPTPARLRRWEAPVRMRLEFAPDVPAEQRRKDTSDVRAYAARLSRLTGHPIALVTDERAANFHILVLDEATRRDYGARIATLVPGIDPLSVRTVTDMPRTASCLVLAFSSSSASTYTRAVAVVRAELPDLTRLSCYHEELAQGLGLPNDSNAARPSIFNDTQEFAILTRHDEILLRILYDERLSPGMTEAEARPIVRDVAAELLGGEI